MTRIVYKALGAVEAGGGAFRRFRSRGILVMTTGERGVGRTRTLNDICLQGRKNCRADNVNYRKACAERVPYLFLGLVERIESIRQRC